MVDEMMSEETGERVKPVSTEFILSKLSVDIEGGRFFWIDPPRNHMGLLNKEAGGARIAAGSNKPYWIIKIDGIPYRRSYLMFQVVKGEWPAFIDHKDGNSINDYHRNLRPATRLQNAQNRKVGKPGKVLPMGVRHLNGRYQSRITVEKKMIHLGCFGSMEEAHIVYQKARVHHFGEWA
jgi:hypothetical protein